MATVITVKDGALARRMPSGTSEALEYVKRFLPCRLSAELSRVAALGACIEEIRIRSEKIIYITVGDCGIKRNMPLECSLSYDEIALIFEKMCDGSIYAHRESIVGGYIPLAMGVRVGVGGRASVEGDKIRGIYNISSLNIRIPRGVLDLDKGIVDVIRGEIARAEGVLIYSPPSEGKTTLLRSLSRHLSGGVSPLRVVLVDTREEIGSLVRERGLSLDVLSGYPKAEGIRIATAFMNPQVIICDEIGSEEAVAISQAQNCGVPLIASAHGSCAEGILRRSGMRFLHEVGAFSLYIGIRISAQGGFEYRVQRAQEVKLENIGCSDIVN